MLLLVQGFQFTCGGDQGTTPAPLWRWDGSNVAIFPWTRDTVLLGSVGCTGRDKPSQHAQVPVIRNFGINLSLLKTTALVIRWFRFKGLWWLTGGGIWTPSSWMTLASCCCRSGDTLTSYASNWTQKTKLSNQLKPDFVSCRYVSQMLKIMLTYSFSFLFLGDSGVRLDDPQVVKLPNQRQSTRLSCQLLVGAVFSSCNSCRREKCCDLSHNKWLKWKAVTEVECLRPKTVWFSLWWFLRIILFHSSEQHLAEKLWDL